MGSTNNTLDSRKILDALEDGVEDVFKAMIASFHDAAVRRLEPIEPRESTHICYLDEACMYRTVQVDEQVFIRFTGDLSGHLVLRCTLTCALNLARGMLMMDEDEALEIEAVRDALGECANILAGSLKTKVLDPKGEFHLGIPEFVHAPPAGTMGGTQVFCLSDDVISIEIWMDAAAAA